MAPEDSAPFAPSSGDTRSPIALRLASTERPPAVCPSPRCQVIDNPVLAVNPPATHRQAKCTQLVLWTLPNCNCNCLPTVHLSLCFAHLIIRRLLRLFAFLCNAWNSCPTSRTQSKQKAYPCNRLYRVYLSFSFSPWPHYPQIGSECAHCLFHWVITFRVHFILCLSD